MAQIFKPRSNTIARATIMGAGSFIVVLASAWDGIFWSPYTTRVNIPLDQPVPFSHRHHVQQDGIDCRYCHTSVEKSAFAGVPDTETCMTCHSQLFNGAPLLAPIRQSLASDTPLRWNRVTKLPDFVFFNHSIHVAKGIGCASCHGPVNEMPLTWKAQTMYMKFCLHCHRNPQDYIRPRDEVFNMLWKYPPNQRMLGRALLFDNKVSTNIIDCGTCHR